MTTKPLMSGIAALAMLGTAPVAASAVTVTSGTVTDAEGRPSAGTVRVYASTVKTGSQPLLGTAQAGSDGAFTVSGDPDQVWQAAKRNGGYLDWVAVADTGSFEGEGGRTSLVRRVGADVELVEPQTAHRVGPAAHAAAKAPAPIVVHARLPRTGTGAAHVRTQDPERERECNTFDREQQKLGQAPAQTVIGELNNAWSDGTVARFSYARGTSSSTYFKWAFKYPGSADFSVAGQAERTFARKGQVTFPPFKRRLSRKLKTSFTYAKYRVRNTKCAPWTYYVRPVSWNTGTDVDTKVKGALDQCDAAALGGGNLPGAVVSTTNARAQSWSGGATVFGAGLTTRSGFDQDVQTTYDFGGRQGEEHYVCGPGGRQSAVDAKRVFAGTLR